MCIPKHKYTIHSKQLAILELSQHKTFVLWKMCIVPYHPDNFEYMIQTLLIAEKF